MASGTLVGRRGNHLTFLLVLAGHVLLISSQVTTEEGHSVLQSGILAVLSPLQRGGEIVLSTTRSAWNEYVDLRAVRTENRQLRERIARLEQALWMDKEAVASYHRLRRVVELAEQLPFQSVVAEVTGVDASAWFQSLTVNRGARQGVRLNAPVVGPGGLVGRVIAVAPGAAQVQLLSDRDCSVGALLVRGRSRGIISGTGTAALQMKYVSNLEDVAVGDLVVTSGIDGMYPKGIAVGRVVQLQNGPRLFKNITVEPAARLERLEEVFILEPVDLGERFSEKVE
jgi:rod shape-determining protein MreC